MGKDNSDNINNSIDNQHLRLIPCSNGQTNVGDNNLHQNIDSTDSTHGNLVHNDSIQQGSFNNLSNVIQMGVSNNDINDQNISIGPISNNNNMNITHLSSEDSNDCQNDQIVISRQQLQDIFNRQFELTALINSIINKKQH
ncbi:7420_t:CDS:1 [Entrophospora sp. SA101]|nr:5992_t:CDS:1 [Entrophospora sp. SA101]CAJ0640266.1 7420_t:CDS:1 [Entrophospora sp. SA101]CAJ0896236.1 13075_t:CDS:1 [Entrophospora sp. SA101]